MITTKLKQILLSRYYWVLLSLFFLSLLLRRYRIEYFSNKSVDRQLLYFINLDFSDAIYAVGFLVISLLFYWFYYVEYVKTKAFELRSFLAFFSFMLIILSCDDLLKGGRILFHTTNILHPSFSTFDWHAAHEYVNPSVSRWIFMAILILILLIKIYLDRKFFLPYKPKA
jgi:hypothetical protein